MAQRWTHPASPASSITLGEAYRDEKAPKKPLRASSSSVLPVVTRAVKASRWRAPADLDSAGAFDLSVGQPEPSSSVWVVPAPGGLLGPVAHGASSVSFGCFRLASLRSISPS